MLAPRLPQRPRVRAQTAGQHLAGLGGGLSTSRLMEPRAFDGGQAGELGTAGRYDRAAGAGRKKQPNCSWASSQRVEQDDQRLRTGQEAAVQGRARRTGQQGSAGSRPERVQEPPDGRVRPLTGFPDGPDPAQVHIELPVGKRSATWWAQRTASARSCPPPADPADGADHHRPARPAVSPDSAASSASPASEACATGPAGGGAPPRARRHGRHRPAHRRRPGRSAPRPRQAPGSGRGRYTGSAAAGRAVRGRGPCRVPPPAPGGRPGRRRAPEPGRLSRERATSAGRVTAPAGDAAPAEALQLAPR